jgi:hypothetical protein
MGWDRLGLIAVNAQKDKPSKGCSFSSLPGAMNDVRIVKTPVENDSICFFHPGILLSLLVYFDRVGGTAGPRLAFPVVCEGYSFR